MNDSEIKVQRCMKKLKQWLKFYPARQVIANLFKVNKKKVTLLIDVNNIEKYCWAWSDETILNNPVFINLEQVENFLMCTVISLSSISASSHDGTWWPNLYDHLN